MEQAHQNEVLLSPCSWVGNLLGQTVGHGECGDTDRRKFLYLTLPARWQEDALFCFCAPAYGWILNVSLGSEKAPACQRASSVTAAHIPEAPRSTIVQQRTSEFAGAMLPPLQLLPRSPGKTAQQYSPLTLCSHHWLSTSSASPLLTDRAIQVHKNEPLKNDGVQTLLHK